jgi:hypothetical protein
MHDIGRTHAGFNLNNINHELCRYTDDVARMLVSTAAGVELDRIRQN